MTRDDLAHVLRAAARIADDGDILVIGSQAILGSFSEDSLPAEAWMSIEVDLAFMDDDVSASKADQVDGAIGELSLFHETNSYYAQGVSVSTAVLPEGWRDRVIPFDTSSSEPAHAVCLDPHDLVVSKLVAMRLKDQEFAAALIRAGLVDPAILLARAKALPTEHAMAARNVERWVRAIAPHVTDPTN